MDVLAAGPQVAGGGQLQGALAALQLDDVLHAPLAPGALADDDRPLVVLQAGRDDLAGAGAVAVDQHRHRESPRRCRPSSPPRSARACCGPAVLTIRPSATNRSADFDAAGQQAAGVEPQIEHEALDVLLAQSLQGLLQVVGRVAAEGGEADVADLLFRVEQEVPVVVGLRRSPSTVSTWIVSRFELERSRRWPSAAANRHVDRACRASPFTA